jgi:hypothetical protein
MFAVEVREETFEKAASGSITGVIWLQMDAIAFPEQGWNDFVVVILGWWTNEASALVAATKNRGEFGFMDGPFMVSVIANGDTWQLDCNKRGRNGTALVHKATVTATEIASGLIHCADIALKRCDKNGWSHADVDELRRGRAALAHAAGANLKEFVDPKL